MNQADPSHPTDEEYFLGTSDVELERLGFQHQVWHSETVHLWNLAGFNHGQSLLDLGCGPGFATIDLLLRVGSQGRVTAVDSSQKYLQETQNRARAMGLSALTTHLGDVLEFESDAQFDGVFARWLFCFLTTPERLVANAARALKPGGRFVIFDYYNYQATTVLPEPSDCQEMFKTYYDSVKATGGSFDVTGRIPQWLEEHGFEIEHLCPLQRTARPGSRLWHWATSFHHSHWPVLRDAGYIDDAAVARFRAGWERAGNRPGAMFNTPPLLGIVARRRA